ncbi:MAG TPA: hypothetical protein VHX86_18445 [Tepidisphaeraceae bacterium]|jgi:hypothetical protein|nr:hypothetical protein [Tepidisphaeraceae bacterium]
MIRVTDQLMQGFVSDDKIRETRHSGNSRLMRVLPSLVAAILCTGLIVEAIATAMNARANGDAMVIVCPILGAVFLTIPAGQAWWALLKALCGR